MDSSGERKAPDRSNPAFVAAQGDVWVFAYGSLMWNPGFVPAANVAARLQGWRRSMCVLSTIYRGTDACPGLVLGLDRGGSCLGRALRVEGADWAAVKARLDQRELPTGVYLPRFLPVRLADGQVVSAYAYVVDRDHWQYWNGPHDDAVKLLRQGHGKGGSARDYLAHAVDHLSQMGISRSSLHRLLRQVDGKT